MVFERDTGIGVSTARHPYSFGYIMAGNWILVLYHHCDCNSDCDSCFSVFSVDAL